MKYLEHMSGELSVGDVVRLTLEASRLEKYRSWPIPLVSRVREAKFGWLWLEGDGRNFNAEEFELIEE